MASCKKYLGVLMSSLFAVAMMTVNGLLSANVGRNATIAATQANPATWVFSIWGVIYAWQVLWLIYDWYLNFTSARDSDGSFFPISFHIIYSLGCTFNASWIIVVTQTNPNLLAPVVIAWILLVSLGVCVGYCVSVSVTIAIPDSVNEKIFLGIVANGLMLYFPWVMLVAPSVAFGSLLYQWTSIGLVAASYAPLVMVLVGVSLFWVAEFWIYADELSPLYSHYVTLFTGLLAVVANGNGLTNGVNVMALVVFFLCVAAFSIKIIRNFCCGGEKQKAYPVTSEPMPV